MPLAWAMLVEAIVVMWFLTRDSAEMNNYRFRNSGQVYAHRPLEAEIKDSIKPIKM
jgi:hypothetical protein